MPISNEMKELLAIGTLRLAMLVKVVAVPEQGSTVIAVCRFGENITFEGTEYIAMPFQPSQFDVSAGVTVDNGTMETVLADTFTRLNLVGGKWQGASFEVNVVDYAHLDYGFAWRKRGRLGEVNTGGVAASTELRGLSSLLQQETGQKTSRRCRYRLGDEKCTVDVERFTSAAAVTAVENKQRFSCLFGQIRSVGLLGEYYLGDHFETHVGNRVDQNIDFNWQLNSPFPSIYPVENGGIGVAYSVRWTGRIEVPTSGNWTFEVEHDDGCKMWINDVVVLDEPALGEHATAPIALVANTPVMFKMEFSNTIGLAYCMLRWSAPLHSQEIVPVGAFSRLADVYDSYFKAGIVTWTSGANEGLTMEVLDNVGDELTLFLPMPGEVGIGDTLSIVAGDDKTLKTCHETFGNAINHGGEDCMPPRDKVFIFPD